MKKFEVISEFSPKGDQPNAIKSITDSKFLLISGKPINEKIARGGPFVMNTKAEILEATKTHLKNIENTAGLLLEDIRSGRDNSTDEIRQEIRLLARTIAALAEDTE